MNTADDDNAGHRARLRERLFKGGPDALLDYELVEYLLALSMPRITTRPKAKALLRHYGSYGALLAADPADLRKNGGLSEVGVAALKIAQASAFRLLESRAKDGKVLGSWQALLDHLQGRMAHRSIEQARILYLDAKNRLIEDQVVAEGTIDEAVIHVREVMHRALVLGATAIILVHNHPSGSPQPSAQDIAFTRAVIEAGRPLKVSVHDHVIVGTEGVSSMKSLGLI